MNHGDSVALILVGVIVHGFLLSLEHPHTHSPSSSANDRCCRPLTRLHCSILPLVSRHRPLPHPTLVDCLTPRIWQLLLLRSRIQQRSSAATHSLLLHCCPLVTATVILRCTVVSFLLLLHRLIGNRLLSFQYFSSPWCHRVVPPSAAPLLHLRITANFFKLIVVF